MLNKLSKITHPELPNVLKRQRCFDIVKSAMDRPIVWISAPAGSGKTTLAASYLKHRGIPHLWYHVDKMDVDIMTLFHYLNLALLPQLKTKVLPDYTSDNSKDILSFAMMYFEHVFAAIKPPYIMVFDDCHDIPCLSGGRAWNK
jgi:ATP/maltotriose-dependent transcriptional regulator MalT